MRTSRSPRAARQGVGTCVDRDRERRRVGAGSEERVAAVARAQVYDDAAVAGGELGDLTDVDVDELFTEERAHAAMVIGGNLGRPALY